MTRHDNTRPARRGAPPVSWLRHALATLGFLALLSTGQPANAQSPQPAAGGASTSIPAAEAPAAAADPALEARVMAIAAELRCLVCQNQTIADSHAELATDLRNQVREMLRQGATQQQVVDYMTARYGDFVLYRPPVKGTTALLWYGPAALLVLAVAVLVVVLRRRSRLAADQFEPDPEEAT
jgi:cytochrome c-type biogenesis protein CcmH